MSRSWLWVTGCLALIGVLPAGAAEEVPEALRAGLARALPGMTAERIVATPLAGIYQVSLGTRIVYVSADGRYLLQGDLFDLTTRRNLTEEAMRVVRREALEALAEDEMIVFAPPAPRHTVTVFTDIDCPYCVKLHSQMAEYNRLGIAVRYLAYPRAGLDSASYRKAVAVWCAEDRRQAITDAKAGRAVAARQCDNPVAAQYRLGRSLGVSGTPTLILEDGSVVPGYLPPRQLLARLERGR